MLHKKLFLCTRSTLLIYCLFFSCQAISRIKDFETTRMKSTAGAGVGSILVEEASLLNPAPLAFYNVSSMYFQKTGIEGNGEDALANQSRESDLKAFILTDTKSKIKGSISYIAEEERTMVNKQYAASMAAPVDKKSSMGFTYKYRKEFNKNTGIETTAKQMVAGFTHAVESDVTLGFVVIDPFGEIPEETRAIIGMQYVYENFASLMIDLGADYNQSLNETLVYRLAGQVKVFGDFFVRAGLFRDRGSLEKGNGAGLGWVSPKLLFDFGFKNYLDESLTTADKVRESSFSVSYRF